MTRITRLLMRLCASFLKGQGCHIVQNRSFHSLCNTAAWAKIVCDDGPDRNQKASIRLLGEQVATLRFNQFGTLVLPGEDPGQV